MPRFLFTGMAGRCRHGTKGRDANFFGVETENRSRQDRESQKFFSASVLYAPRSNPTSDWCYQVDKLFFSKFLQLHTTSVHTTRGTGIFRVVVVVVALVDVVIFLSKTRKFTRLRQVFFFLS